DSLRANHALTVTETTVSGCAASSLPTPLTYDRSGLELVAVGLDEAEENLVIDYLVKQPQHYPQPRIALQVASPAGSPWQAHSSLAVGNNRFLIPYANVALNRYRLRGFNNC